jgi:hypothetical protein
VRNFDWLPFTPPLVAFFGPSDFFTFFWLDGIPPPRRLEVNLHQHRPFLVIDASEHGKLSVDGGVLRDGR